MTIALISGMYWLFVGGLAWFANHLKSLSTMLDKQEQIIENKEFIEDFGFRMKINALFERLWPRLKNTNSQDIKKSLSKWMCIGFVSILALCYLFPNVMKSAAPVLFLGLGFFSIIGNALRQDRQIEKASKRFVIPFCFITCTFIGYQIDTSAKAKHIKDILISIPIPYSAAILIFVLACAILSYLCIRLVERFQVVFVELILRRTLLLAKRLVIVGVTPRLPEESEIRAIAKDALTATVSSMTLFGLVVGAAYAIIGSIFF